MAADYNNYFEELQKINLAIRLDGGGSFDGTAAITSLKGDLVWLELFGSEQPPRGGVQPGGEAWVSVWTGGACAAATPGWIRSAMSVSFPSVWSVRSRRRNDGSISGST